MIGEIVSHFRILGELGQGGMGVVYKAEDTALGRLVALKFLPHSLIARNNEKERFYHEARAAAAINHPHVTTIYEIGEYEGQLYLAMECVEGETLKGYLTHETPPLPKALDIAIQTGQALAAAHEKGVVHRDIKSDNIMITPKGDIKVTDFGLAMLRGGTRLTQAGSTLGTAAYMSPEQARGEEVDQRTDIFSFGVVLYELLTGRLPFQGEHQAALLYAVMNEEPLPVARFNNDADPETERIVEKALAKDPAERYQHMDEMVADLRRERRRLESPHAPSVTKALSPAASGPHPPAADAASPSPGSRMPRRKSVVRSIIPFAALAAVLLALVIVNPFNFQLAVQQGKAEEQGSSLAVLYFQNIPDPEDRDHTGDMLTDLLTTALSQDKALQVVSRERLYDIQKGLGQGEVKTISPALAQKLAERAGVSMMLLGSVVQREPSLAVTVRVVSVRSGNIVSSQRLSGFSSSRMFALVDTLALLVRSEVSPKHVLSPKAEPKSIAEVTTASQEAYRLYVEGVNLSRRYLMGEAKMVLNRAIELDSNFAMAYFALGGSEINRDDIVRRPFLQKAWNLRARTTEKERLQIEAEYQDVVMGKTDEAAAILEQFVERYPYELQAYSQLAMKYNKLGWSDKALLARERIIQKDSLNQDAWNTLAYQYAGFNRREEALKAANRSIALAPGEPNPYDSKGEIYMIFGEVDSAFNYYQKALTLRSDFATVEKLGYKMMLDQKYASAHEYFRRFGESQDIEQVMQARFDELMISVYQGKILYARQALLQLLPQMQTDKLDVVVLNVLQMLVLLSEEAGDGAAAVLYARQLTAFQKSMHGEFAGGQVLLAEALWQAGDRTGSDSVMGAVGDKMKGQPAYRQKRYLFAMGHISCCKRTYDRAREFFQRSFDIGYPVHAPQFLYGVTLLKTNHADEAIAELTSVIRWVPISFPPIELSNHSTWVEWPISAAKAHYWLAVAYEQKGEKASAQREFGKFLEIWKGADFPSPELKDARVRLARLQR